jgi:ribosome-associated protein
MAKTRRLKAPAKTNEARQLLLAVVKGIQEKKGQEITTLNLKKLGSSLADYFVVCHGDSRPQLEAIARSVEETVSKRLDENPRHVEGLENAEWILMDYFDVVVHIFLKEKRAFYGLERLWADAEMKKQA